MTIAGIDIVIVALLLVVGGAEIGFASAMLLIRRHLLKGGGVRDYDGGVRYLQEKQR